MLREAFADVSDDSVGFPGGSGPVSVLIYSTEFTPSVGGRPSIAKELAAAMAESRDVVKSAPVQLSDVIVVTSTPAGKIDDFQFPFEVVRKPSLVKLFSLVRKSDFFIVIGPDILPIAVGLLLRKPVVVRHDAYHAVCPAGNYLHQPGGVPCVGHFQKGNYSDCYRCQRVDINASRSVRNLVLTYLRLSLVNHVASNIAPTFYAACQLGLPRTETIYYGIKNPLDKSFRPN